MVLGTLAATAAFTIRLTMRDENPAVAKAKIARLRFGPRRRALSAASATQTRP